MQVEAIYTFKNYMYIETSGFFAQIKVEKICLISRGRFHTENNYSTRACWLSIIVGYLLSHTQRALVE